MAASQNGFCSYKLPIHNKTSTPGIMQIMTKNITIFIYLIFCHCETRSFYDTFLELSKHRFVTQPLQNPPFCSSTPDPHHQWCGSATKHGGATKKESEDGRNNHLYNKFRISVVSTRNVIYRCHIFSGSIPIKWDTGMQCCRSWFVSRCLFDPWIMDPEKAPKPIFLRAQWQFMGEFYNSLKTCPNFFLPHFKNK